MREKNHESKKAQEEEPSENYVLRRYKKAIDYYWKASKKNKRAYKLSRSLTIILGALVTLISSISSANFISSSYRLSTIFAIVTPLAAAALTIIGGFAQSFHWGATWRDMVVNASRLEKERDRILSKKLPKANVAKKELETLNNLIIEESQNFFKRVVEGKADTTNSEDSEGKS